MNYKKTFNKIKLNTEVFMVQRFPYVFPDDHLTRAREIMRDTGVRLLPVIDDTSNMRLQGIIYRIDLLNVTSTKTNLLVKDVMNEPQVFIAPDEDVREAVKKMLQVDEWYAPVIDNDRRLRGILGLEGIIRYYLNNNPEILDKPVLEYCTRRIESIKVNDEVPKVWYKMLKHKYAGLPVVKEDGTLVGVVTQYDLLKRGFARVELESETKPRKTYVRDIMMTPAIAIDPDASLKDAAVIMIERNIGRVYIIGSKKKLVGVVDREDIVRFLLNEKR